MNVSLHSTPQKKQEMSRAHKARKSKSLLAEKKRSCDLRNSRRVKVLERLRTETYASPSSMSFLYGPLHFVALCLILGFKLSLERSDFPDE